MQQPILKEFPQEFHTERLYIRLPLPGDGEIVHEAISVSKEALKKWLPFAQKDQTLEETEANIREAHLAFLKRDDLRLHIFAQNSGAFVGSTGLHRIDWSIPKFEIGYWLDSRQIGKGYMTEAVAGLTAFAFEQLAAQRVEVRCDSKNIKSRAIAERLGFTLEGILKKDSLAVDSEELRDTCVFAKVR
ncbi:MULTISPECIES: GNAT family N-acetyltransferase [unclassified Virgibacillus]|uniref:GNAT family N-acetyltransferase n=1 Tax=unclassified Virgibacillus TaxID=2620237 RepID=UPI0024DE999F|nr:GNAT family N-acetyltransferase [Virgibacillus sp. LDC-1]